ncbi:HMCN1 [Branchiostoma lanceolatum]|uniref:HMCN1 protein n=1 Tax=Branchiostoma lanceolatum TaxID=7740 RepID=A0A8J9VEP8_BRALA|nr:HMCN1 [Branchiostoma lanceolatum]
MSLLKVVSCLSFLLCFMLKNGLACVPTSQPCTGNCVHGGWTDWTEYTDCSVDSGTGKRVRTRTCTNPAPAGGGNFCDGDTFEVLDCSGDTCSAGDYQWSAWSDYMACSVTCGSNGVQTRTRTCTCTTTSNPAANATESCGGDSEERTDCTATVAPCPQHGGWSSWAAWTSCPVTCGGGRLWRERECTNPAPAYGGNNCTGVTHESADCATADCPTAGNVTDQDSALTSREIIILSTLLPIVIILMVTLAVFVTLWRGAKNAAAVSPSIGIRQGPSTAGPIPPQAAGGSHDYMGACLEHGSEHPFKEKYMKKPPPYSP